VTLPVAVVGLGWAARSIWLPRIIGHPAYTLVSVVDPSIRARTEFAAGNGGVAVLADVAELDPDSVELVIVAVPNHLHCRIGCGLLARGFAVFVEKPLCLSSHEARRLTEAERAGTGVLLGGSAAKYRADIRACHDLAATLGRIRHVELAWVRSRGVPGAGWFTSRELAGGGALLDLGWHLLDALSPMLGLVEVEQVLSTLSADFLGTQDSQAVWRRDENGRVRPGDVEDTVRAFLLTRARISILLRASWASHEPHDSTTLKIEGSAGTVTLACTFGFSPLRLPGSALRLTRDSGRVPVPVPDEPVGIEYQRQLDDLPALLADPNSRGRAAREASWTIGVIERIYRSAMATAPADL
jgi:oxidoreductase